MANPSFFTLPREIRYIVYEELFRDSHCNIQIYKHNIQLCRAFAQTSPLSLLLTNKSISSEVQNVLYATTTFNIQLHVQHLPLLHQQRLFLPNPRHQRSARYGSLPILNLPVALQKYLKRILRLELDVWIGDYGKLDAMLDQFEAFKAALGCDEPRREFQCMKVRVRLQPRWMSKGTQAPVEGEGDELVKSVVALRRCARRAELIIEDGAEVLLSRDCLRALRSEPR